MAFKNAVKNLIAHFGIVWSLLLYIIIITALLCGLSLPFVLPIADAFADAGVFDGISNSFSALFNEGGWTGFWDGLYGVYVAVIGVFRDNGRVASLVMMFMIFILVVAFRFFFGLYEVPLATVLDGRMSCNARYGLGGKFFSTLSVSVRYSLAKMPITTAFDAAMLASLYGFGMWLGLSVALPFVIILVIWLFQSFKNAMLACWAPAVADGMGVIKGFGRSVEICFKRFRSIFSTYLMTHLLLIAFVVFITLFTLGVGLMIGVPLVIACLGYLDITEYYNKTGKRYYIDGAVFTPPTENVL